MTAPSQAAAALSGHAGRGLFLVLEGGEGSGKTTGSAGLAGALQGWGYDVVQTREPGGTPEGLALRGLLLAEDGPAWQPYAELLLMVAARVQHVRRVIEPALAKGRTVLCDRFVGSTLAYQGAGRGVEAELILDLHRRCVSDLWPDLTILLDVAPEIGLARSKRRLDQAGTDETRFETMDLAFHARVRDDFLKQSTMRPSAVVDGSCPMDVVQQRVLDCAASWLRVRDAGRDEESRYPGGRRSSGGA